MPLKQYLLFSGQQYYPGGGMSDFIGSFDTIELAKKEIWENRYFDDWFQIFDSESMTIIYEKQ